MKTIETQPPLHEEKEVLSLLASGYSNREIAARLQAAVETVAVLKSEAMKRLSLKSRIDIIRYARQQGWME